MLQPLLSRGTAFAGWLPVATTLLILAGCGGASRTSHGSSSEASTAAPASSAASSRSPASPKGKIRAEDGAGKLLFELSPSAKGYDVTAAGGRRLGTVKVETDRVKASDERGQPAFKVTQKDRGFKLYREPAAPGGADVELAGLRAEAGDFRIKDARDQELFRGKAKESKTKVSAPGGQSWGVKVKDDGVEVEDATGKRVLRVKGLRSVPAAVFSAAPQYSPLQKAAVAVYCARIGP